MKLILYKYAATPERIDKTDYLTQLGEIDEVKLKEDTNLMKPVFILKTPKGDASNLWDANYVKCVDTGRYYYINNITAMTGGRISIDGQIDVLYTYKDDILNSSGWVSSASGPVTSADKMMKNNFPFREDCNIEIKKFPNTIFNNTSTGPIGARYYCQYIGYGVHDLT